jgi:hypothetical protein
VLVDDKLGAESKMGLLTQPRHLRGQPNRDASPRTAGL